MQQVKLLFQVFTDKTLFLDWLLDINLAIGQKICNLKAKYEIDIYFEENKEMDLRVAPKFIKDNKIYDADVLKMRWDLCSSCEFLTESNNCKKCGCFMSGKHKMKQAFCPIGKWGKYIEENLNGIKSTSTI